MLIGCYPNSLAAVLSALSIPSILGRIDDPLTQGMNEYKVIEGHLIVNSTNITIDDIVDDSLGRYPYTMSSVNQYQDGMNICLLFVCE